MVIVGAITSAIDFYEIYSCNTACSCWREKLTAGFFWTLEWSCWIISICHEGVLIQRGPMDPRPCITYHDTTCGMEWYTWLSEVTGSVKHSMSEEGMTYSGRKYWLGVGKFDGSGSRYDTDGGVVGLIFHYKPPNGSCWNNFMANVNKQPMCCVDPHFALLSVDEIIPMWMENMDHCHWEVEVEVCDAIHNGVHPYQTPPVKYYRKISTLEHGINAICGHTSWCCCILQSNDQEW